MINILHFIDHYNIGGPGKTIINSAKYIDSGHFFIHVSSFMQPDGQMTEFARAVRSARIPYIPLTDARGINLTALRTLRDYMRRHRINILHTHGYKTDLIGLLLKTLYQDFLLVTTHHGWIVNNTRQSLFKKIDLTLSILFDGVITVSKALQAELPNMRRRGPISTVIQNAIVAEDYCKKDERRTIRQTYQVRKADLLVGVIGRLSNEKGCLDMLEAFQLAAQGNRSLHLIFVGDGPLLEPMKEKILDLNLAHTVTLAGYQNPVHPYYDAMDILVCPSHTEGISNVILESMAFGLPVIATRVGGNPELIKPHFNGLLVPARNARAMAEAITAMAADADMRIRYGENGRRCVEERFSFQKRMQHVEVFYTKIMARKNRVD